MSRGKKSQLTVEVYRQLKAEGLNRGEIATRLGLTDTAISKFTARHKKELEMASVDSSYTTKPKAPDINPDATAMLIEHANGLKKQIDAVQTEIDKGGTQATKNREVLIKLTQEYRQITVAIAGISDKLDDRRVMFGLWKNVMKVLEEKLPTKLRDEVVQALWQIASPYIETFKSKSEVTNNEQQAD